VISTDLFTSKVITIIDEDSTVSARVSKTRDLVFVKGDLQLKNQGLCRLDNIFGDTIETSKSRKSDVKPMISTGMQLLSLPLILNGLKIIMKK